MALLRRDGTANQSWRALIYTTATPLTAVWAPEPTRTVTVTSSFALVRDGRWDDFLASWYAASITPTVGAWCQYIAPPLVSSEVTETLHLSVSAGVGVLTLAWSATGDDAAAGYWIVSRETGGATGPWSQPRR